MVQGMHPQQQALANRLNELGLTDEEGEIVQGLFGWYNRDRSLNTFYHCAEPHYAMLKCCGNSDEVDAKRSLTLKSVVKKLLRWDGQASEELIERLENQLDMSRISAIWTACQLGLPEALYKALYHEVLHIKLMTPESNDIKTVTMVALIALLGSAKPT